MVSVASLNRDNTPAAHSDYNAAKDISAPGMNILGTQANATVRPGAADSVNDYIQRTGTSFATPITVGIASLVWTANPALTSYQVEDILKTTATPIDYSSKPGMGSAGAVDAYAAVEKALAMRDVVDIATCTVAPIASPRYANTALTPSVTITSPEGSPLAEGIDYTLTYSNNVRAGEGTVAIQGIGSYSGVRNESFVIKPSSSNLVLLVRFKGDTTGNGETGMNAFHAKYGTQWAYLQALYNEPGKTDYLGESARSYLQAVSDKKFDLMSYFPQTQGDNTKVTYLDLPRTREQYEAISDNDTTFMTDTVNAFNAAYPSFNPSELDADGDGVLDNVTVIPTLNSYPLLGTVFWPHKGIVPWGMLSIGGKFVVNYNLNDSKNMSGYPVGLIAHEFLHTLGAPDYYRPPGRSGIPVGPWDIMSKADSALFYPLAVTRADRGWTTIPEKTASGTYTLHAPGAGGEQSFMFRSSLSEDEYFVVEYRKKGENKVVDIDGELTASGLVVYRVNDLHREAGNWGRDDYVYVFRPNETALGAAEGDIDNAQAVAPGTLHRSVIGSTDPAATVEQGAIVYADGTNSQAQVSVESISDDQTSITFNLALHDFSADGLWDTVKNPDGATQFSSDAGNFTITSDGSRLYTVLEESTGTSRSYQVMSYDGTDWVRIGDTLSDGKERDNASSAVHNGSLYLLATDWDHGISLMRLDLGTRAWSQVSWTNPSSSTVANRPALGVAGGNLYVIADANGRDPSVFQLSADASRLDRVGAHPLATVDLEATPRVLDVGGSLALAVSGYGQGTKLYRQEGGGGWSTTELWNVDATQMQAVSSAGASYLLLSSGARGPRLIEVDSTGTVSQDVGPLWMGRNNLAKGTSLVVQGSQLYLADGMSDNKVGAFAIARSSLSAEKSSWTPVGGAVFPRAMDVSMALVGDKVYCAVADPSTRQAYMRTHEAEAEPPVPPMISVTVPTGARFTITPGETDDPSASISASDTLQITNRSAVPVWVSVSKVATSGVSLSNTEAGLSTERSLMLALSDSAPSGFGIAEDWLPSVVAGSAVEGIAYLPFNRAANGKLAASSTAEGTASPVLRLYGKTLVNGWTPSGGDTFTVTPTFTITATDPASTP